MRPTYHIVSHSHWDREWYFTFDRFRAMLVDMIEDLLALFERDPEFVSYTLDGQMAAVMDYLEVRPERAETIRRLVQTRKLFIGPWYILNDEFLSSGESHIRNLMLGLRLGESLGGAMNVGYIPDQFGHIAQMPQILQGFGIDTALIYRGFGGEPGQEPSEYWWTSPDGSKVLMHHLPKDGYSAGYFGTKDEAVIRQKFDRLRAELDARGTTSQRLFFNGGDHHWPDAEVSEAIRVLRQRDDAFFRHSNFPDFFDALKKEIGDGQQLRTLEGETRFGYRHAFAVLGGVFSSRMYLKQMNAASEVLLERHLEPLNVLASLKGMRSKAPQIGQAWKYVLQNQDHDAICGTSIDEVHREMVVRTNKAEQIGRHVLAECFARLLPYDEREHHDDRFLFVFNPSPFSRNECLEADIEFFLQDVIVGLNPEVKVDERRESAKGFSILTPGGRELPYQILRREEDFGVTYSKRDYPHQTLVDRFSILLSPGDVPPTGWKGLSIVRRDQPPVFAPEIQVGKDFLENEFLRVEINPEGSIRLVDKATQSVYEKLNFFEDSGDAGDEYNYSYPEHDGLFVSGQFPVDVTVEEGGPLRGAIRLDHHMRLPRSASEDRKSRSPESAEFTVSTLLTLTRSSRRVDIRTTVKNTVKDHRFRALFATGIDTDESFAETPFAVVQRRHGTYDTRNFPFEHPALVAPMYRFVTLRDENKGLTLIVKGLPEYELKLNDRGVLALTLLRSVGVLSGRDLITRPGGAAGWWNDTPDAQCPGTHVFEYSVFPHAPEVTKSWSSILKEVELFTVPSLAVMRKNDQDLSEQSFLSIQPDSLLLSALKLADRRDGVIVRLSNPVDRNVAGVLELKRPVKAAFRTTMNENILGEVEVHEEREIGIAVRPFEVVSVLLTF